MAPNTGYIEIDLECDFVHIISKLKLEHLKANLRFKIDLSSIVSEGLKVHHFTYT